MQSMRLLIAACVFVACSLILESIVLLIGVLA